MLAPHPRRASLHPLVPLPNADVGAARLLGGVTLAVAGDPVAAAIGARLGARLVKVADEDRAAYHAAACVAANHVVALLGQVERIAATVGLPVDAFLGLTRAALDDVAALGPRAALTGPASRGDWATIARHLEALDPAERAGYGAGVALALELAGARARGVDRGHRRHRGRRTRRAAVGDRGRHHARRVARRAPTGCGARVAPSGSP